MNENCIHLAARNPNANVIKRLYDEINIEENDINEKDSQGYTPLLTALEYNPNFEIAEFLIQNGADYKDYEAKIKFGLTTLLCAAKNKNPQILGYVLKKQFVRQ